MAATSSTASDLATVLARLRGALPELRRRFPLADLAVFGSRARGSAGTDSDLDLLVEWSGPASLLDHAGLRAELEERTGLSVELTNRRAERAEADCKARRRYLREGYPIR